MEEWGAEKRKVNINVPSRKALGGWEAFLLLLLLLYGLVSHPRCSFHPFLSGMPSHMPSTPHVLP